jgi:hypothetical protein
MRTRLTLPMRFNTEKRATGVIRDNSLFGLGALAIELPGTGGSRWRIVIDTERPDTVARYLSQNNTPGIEWARSELP